MKWYSNDEDASTRRRSYAGAFAPVRHEVGGAPPVAIRAGWLVVKNRRRRISGSRLHILGRSSSQKEKRSRESGQHGFSYDLEVLPDCEAKFVRTEISRVSVSTLDQERYHRVVPGRDLDHGVVGNSTEPARHAIERHSAANREVMNHGKGEHHVCRAAVSE